MIFRYLYILNKATTAKEENEKEAIIERIQIEITAKQMENLGNISNIEVRRILKTYGDIKGEILITEEEKYQINIKDIWSNFNINNPYEGAKVSILGDSISTLKGYIPETNRARYVQNESEAINGLINMNFEETWWGNLIEDLNMNLGINDSWAGSRITNTSTTNTGDIGPDRTISSMKRIENLGNNGTPDVIFLFGGTNDIGNNVDIGIFNSEIALDTTSTIYSNFADAYTITIKRIQYLYPNTDIIVLLPMYTSSYYTSENLNKYNKVIKEICEYYDLKYIELTECGINTGNLSNYLVDGIHPNAMGMQLIKNYVKNQIVNGQIEESHIQELPKNYTASANLVTKLE